MRIARLLQSYRIDSNAALAFSRALGSRIIDKLSR